MQDTENIVLEYKSTTFHRLSNPLTTLPWWAGFRISICTLGLSAELYTAVTPYHPNPNKTGRRGKQQRKAYYVP